MTRRLNVVLLALLIIVGAPFAWLLLDASTAASAAKPVTIAALRQLAGALPGEPPREVRYETVGRRWVVSDLLAAGTGLRPVPIAIRAYELVLEDGRLITIDRGMSRDVARRHHVQDYDPEAQALIDQAVAASRFNLLLAPDVQHSGRRGFVPSRDPRRLPFAIAPGVVVIPVDSIAPGERMIYVRLANGREVLFTGDVAPIHASWEQQRPPARLVTTFFVGDDRTEIAAWLRTVDALRGQAPSLHIVTGHDQVVPRVVTRGFLADPESEPSNQP